LQKFLQKAYKAVRYPQLVFRHLELHCERKAISRLKGAMDLNQERHRSLQFLSEQFNCDVESYLDEYRHSGLREQFAAGLKRLHGALDQSSSAMDCETLYLTVRAAKPTVIVETGVLYGAMTWHAIEAMRRNGGGVIHSVDLPRPKDDRTPPLGILIPDQLRCDWHLHLGDSLKILPDLLRDLGEIHMFNHDSHHTVEHMLLEYGLAHNAIVPGGLLTSHDVVHSKHSPNAFLLFTDCFRYHAISCRNFGIARKLPVH